MLKNPPKLFPQPCGEAHQCTVFFKIRNINNFSLLWFSLLPLHTGYLFFRFLVISLFELPTFLQGQQGLKKENRAWSEEGDYSAWEKDEQRPRFRVEKEGERERIERKPSLRRQGCRWVCWGRPSLVAWFLHMPCTCLSASVDSLAFHVADWSEERRQFNLFPLNHSALLPLVNFYPTSCWFPLDKFILRLFIYINYRIPQWANVPNL